MHYYQEITIGYLKEEMEKFLLTKGYKIGFEIDQGDWDRYTKDWCEDMKPAVKKDDKIIELKDAFKEEFEKHFNKIMGI
jgi:ribulose bisphosphate carboxylase small subunit